MKPKKLNLRKRLAWITLPVLFWCGMIITGIVSCSHDMPQIQSSKKPAFRLPDLPEGMTDPEQRAEYLVMHYWDNYNFSDTAYLHFPEVTEQAIADYIAVLPYVGESMQQGSIHEMLYRAEEKKFLFRFFTELLEKYLYDPNSPLCNEEYYRHVLCYIDATTALDEVQKIRFSSQLKSVRKNRKGTKANDFTYMLADGTKKQMHDIEADYLLLYFNNPGCHACEEIQIQLESSAVVSTSIENGRLKVLALYPDEDLTEWKAEQSRMPATWINGCDAGQSIQENELYDLRAIPSLYLLDKDKIVLLKDGKVNQLEEILSDKNIQG